MADERITIEHEDGYPSGFTMLDNRDIWDCQGRDRKLLLRPTTLGIYAAMRSMPRNWQFREDWLLEHLRIGKALLRRAVHELEAVRRLDRHQQRDTTGKYLGTIWTLHRGGGQGEPSTDFRSADKPVDRKNRGRVNPPSENPPSKNKEESNKTDSTTTTTHKELVWPRQLPETQRVVVMQMLSPFSSDQQQQLLDELAGAQAAATPPRRPMAWLRSVIDRARRGEYVPDLAIGVAASRRRQLADAEAERKRRDEKTAAEARLRDPIARERGLAAMRAARAQLQNHGLFNQEEPSNA